jgi:outer membrane receptor protein involved in Fe transport
MRVQSVVSWIAVVGTLTTWPAGPAVGQQLTLAAWTPRFFYVPSTAAKPLEIDVRHNAMLGQVVSLHVGKATIGGLLAEIQRQTGLTFAYDPNFPATRPVTLQAESITVASALGAILIGTGVDVVLTPTGHVWLAEARPRAPYIQEGSVVGKATDKESGSPLVGATVTLDPARESAITGSEGDYRFTNLTPGDYTLRARYIGYRSLVVSVTVSASQETMVDFPMVKSAQQLDEVVTTGTVVPTEVRALPTPVSVITASDLEQQRPRTIGQALRQTVPSTVAWDLPNFSYYTPLSARGASSLSVGTGAMKVFIDGIEVANRAAAVVDPASIERVEVIRGPQAATIYGSDAIGGVIQVFTKRGDSTATRPRIGASALLGVVQSPYKGYRNTLSQQYAGSIRGAGQSFSYNVGGGYTRLGEWVPEGGQSLPSVYGGIRVQQSAFTLDLSGRYYQQSLKQNFSPVFVGTGLSFFSEPSYTPQSAKEQTLGAKVTWATTPWLRQNVSAGIDQYLFNAVQSRPRFTTPADTFLSFSDDDRTKLFIAYNASASVILARDLGATATAGLDHYDFRIQQEFTGGALDTTNTIRTNPSQPFTVIRSAVKNTGYFGQLQLSYRSALFLTAGLRADDNSTFGSDLGRPVSPRVGIAYATTPGSATIKARGSYGQATSPPSPGFSQAGYSGTVAFQLANPQLGPERQKGWDAGLDVVFGTRGSLSATYYDQTADDLIQYVTIDLGPPLVRQYQNVGRVSNVGLEVEGTLGLGAVQLKGNFSIANSRIEALAPNYTGDLRVGERPLEVPKYTAGASLALFALPGTTVTTGFTYVGSWTSYDYYAQFACFGQTGACRPTQRDYIITYPGFVKVDVSLNQRLTPVVSAVVQVQNVANNEVTESSNFRPAMGRLAMVGLEAHY